MGVLVVVFVVWCCVFVCEFVDDGGVCVVVGGGYVGASGGVAVVVIVVNVGLFGATTAVDVAGIVRATKVLFIFLILPAVCVVDLYRWRRRSCLSGSCSGKRLWLGWKRPWRARNTTCSSRPFRYWRVHLCCCFCDGTGGVDVAGVGGNVVVGVDVVCVRACVSACVVVVGIGVFGAGIDVGVFGVGLSADAVGAGVSVGVVVVVFDVRVFVCGC